MRFHEIAEIIGGEIIGDPDIEITGVSSIEEAKAGDITFLADKKSLSAIYESKASAVITKTAIEDLSAGMLIVDNPRLAFARVLEIFYTRPSKPSGISKEAVIGQNVNLGNDVSICPLVFISDNVSIGDRVNIFPGVSIGGKVSIGEDSVIYPNVTIRENVKIGRNVLIHSGVVIGSDGFGYVLDKEKHYKIPQVGGVLIEDNVEIGANTSIDRATIGNTVIGSGTKIDNLVQIAHNVKIGRDCVIVAQVGIGGSVKIGDGAVIGAQAGIRDHMNIGKGVMIGAQSGVGHDIPDGQVFSGTPAIPHKTWLRSQSIYSKLSGYIKRLLELERKLNPDTNKTSNGVKKESCSNDG